MNRIGSSRDSQDESIRACDSAHISNQRVQISERTLSVIAFGLAVAAFVMALWCMHDAEIDRQWNNREITRLVHEVNVRDVLLQDHDALLIREGFKTPADVAKGPTGNLEYQPRK
jgi:hypothetical protein